jgi:hypothetical protein
MAHMEIRRTAIQGQLREKLVRPYLKEQPGVVVHAKQEL